MQQLIMNGPVPFKLAPSGKDYLWGGTKLKTDWGKQIDLDPLAETWECSVHPDGPSTVVSGEFAGKTLAQVLEEHPEFMGKAPIREGEFPLLIKFIDAKKDLSVQVHPNDTYAMDKENGSLGKTEMWYVLEAEEGACLVYGFNQDMDRETLARSMQDGTLEQYLNKVPVHKGDVFFIPAGQVHAIGYGILLAEIQENSNLTYRLYDYNRRDKDGNLRPLHIEKALEVSNLKKSEWIKAQRKTEVLSGMKVEEVCSCNYFTSQRFVVDEASSEGGIITSLTDSFRVLLCLDGKGKITWGKDQELVLVKGDCIFIPAKAPDVIMTGTAEVLSVHC